MTHRDAYDWPFEPFDRPHSVRGYFNDPRIADNSKAFHFGVDICAADGTPVYAIDPGTVHLEGARSLSVVSDGGGRTFGYWHVVPAVRHHAHVRRHQLLGHVEASWGHLHFAESSRKRYRNPLRPGGLGPWSDPTSPRISGIQLFRGKKEVSPLDVRGSVDVIVEAWDKPPLPIPPPWSGSIVTPAMLRWRVLRGRRVVRPWHAPVDFRKTLLPASLFPVVYTPDTRQNHPHHPGLYRFYAAHTWDTKLLPNGHYRLEVAVADAQGNRAHAALPFAVANRR